MERVEKQQFRDEMFLVFLVVRPGTKAAQGVSQSDLAKRMKVNQVGNGPNVHSFEKNINDKDPMSS